MKKWFYKLTVVLLLLCPIVGFSFTFTVASTNETCAGNGTLTFTAFNADPSGSIVYVVYKLPDLTTPYASGTDNTVSGLTAGTYHIEARETVGSTTTIQETDVTIISTVTPMTYSVQALNQACATTSNILVTVNTGTAATYEIFSGPVTFPPQASNTFSGLPNGVYNIKVIDNCGNALVQTFTVTLNPTGLSISPPAFTNTVPPSCTSIVVSNTITPAPGTVIGYPLQIGYVLHLPDGTTTTNNLVLNSGNPTSEVLSQTFPYFANQSYLYDLTITDACGITYPVNSFSVSNEITIEGSPQDLPCNKHYFTLATSNYVGPYTLQFDSFPAGFTPSAFNSSYPGPYVPGSVAFGGDTQPVPFGHYIVTVTDSCGRTDTVDFEVISQPPTLNIVGNSHGCQSTDGQIVAFVSGSKIVTAIVTAAPASYPFPLPHNVTANINAGGVVLLEPVPLGDYTLLITDDCGDIFDPQNVTIAPYEDQNTTVTVLEGCGPGRGSLELFSNNGPLTSAIITTAPAGFPFALPYTVSNNIVATGGKLYLNDLPAGSYTINTTDSCGFSASTPILIDGYAITTNNYSLVGNCGSFDIPLDFVSNASTQDDFWLQKLLDPATDTWGHPDTEVPYVPGSVPNATTGVGLQNNITNLNLIYNGTFRIVHHFTSYNNGSDINSHLVTNEIKDCVEILSPVLTFDRVLAINDVYRVPCSTNGNLDVILFTSGEPPLHFTITEKDGFPFSLDNGASNIFLNIAPGIYKFQIEDNCGNTITRTFDVSDLASLVIVYPVCNLFSCSEVTNGIESFDLSSQNTTLLGIQSPALYTLSYYTSLANAENNTSPIANITNFTPTANPQTIYVRMIFNQFPNCYQTGSFDLITGQTPAINLSAEYLVCDGLPIVLDAGIGNLPITTYSWSNGAVTPSITVSDVGITNVSVTATNTYGICNTIPQSCATFMDIMVNIAAIPEIDHIATDDWTANENSITVVTTSAGDFEYSIDGSNYQPENNFTHLTPGIYTVYVRDTNGCRLVFQEVWLLNYPQYFTPNGDGINDKWRIRNSENEPHFQVYIYDRYGKLITGFPSDNEGWDGNLNGKLLFSDDYWFVVHREDGRILKGHFALKR